MALSSQGEVFLPCDEVLALLLVCYAQINVFVFAWVVCCDDSGVVSACPPHEYPALSSKACLIPSNLLYVFPAFPETDSASAPLLHSSSMLVLMYIVQ